MAAVGRAVAALKLLIRGTMRMIVDRASLKIHGDALELINDTKRNHSFHHTSSQGDEMAAERGGEGGWRGR